MIPKELEGVIVRTPGVLSGGLRFVGTRVFVQSLFDTIESGHDIDSFLKGFPDVAREQAEAVAAFARNSPGPHDLDTAWKAVIRTG